MADIVWTNVTIKLADLKPWRGNPKKSTAKNAKQLQTSFDELGQFQTVAVGPDGEVYDGHQRLSALLAAHGKNYQLEARQSSRPLTEQERRKIAIYSRQIGAWDWDILSGWEPTELTAWGFDVDLLSDWRRDVAALGDFLESEEEDYSPPDAQPSPRQLPIDVIYTLQGADGTCCLAVRAGLKYGIQSPRSIICPYCLRGDEAHKVVFIDNDYFNYDHSSHIKMVSALKPKYATVCDVMTPQQCTKDKIKHHELDLILDWAEELRQYAENVIVIPKYDCLDKIPDYFMLGYSVPTSHGGTPLPPEAFKGRRVHLLGGSWKAQLSHMAILGDDVVSIDNNYINHIARQYGLVLFPNGETKQLRDIGLGHVTNPRYAALSLSFGAMGAKINELYRPPDDGGGTENFNMVVTATNHKKQGDFAECHNEPSIVLFWYVLLMLPRKCWRTLLV